MVRRDLVQTLSRKLPKIKERPAFPLNKDIARYYWAFAPEKDFFVTAILQNPFGETKQLAKLKKQAGVTVWKNLKILNRLHRKELFWTKDYEKHKPLINLFLVNYIFICDQEKKYPQAAKMLLRSKLRSTMKLLAQNDVSGIRDELEDRLFSRLEPKIYQHYATLLGFSRKTFEGYEKEIRQKLKKLMKRAGIKGEIQSRFKSVWGIHRKVVRKNILYSQVLDVIGLRILVEQEAECYQIMELILTNWPVLNSKIKDYIAVPKENLYRSLHLTITYNNHPVEIQIRTYEMHREAQYGRAAHLFYKEKGGLI